MLSSEELGKKAAAYRAVDEFVTRTGMVVGVGSGSTVAYVIERLAQTSVRPVCVPTSYQSRLLLQQHDTLTVATLDTHPVLDVCIDGADEVDPQLNLIKGGGACQTQEKIVASCAKRLVIVADSRKQSQVLGRAWRQGVPLEVVPMARRPVENALRAIGGTPTLRMGVKKAGPVVTDNGGFVIDCDFGDITAPAELEHKLRSIVGIVETGLFCGMAEVALFGQPDGSVVRWARGSSHL